MSAGVPEVAVGLARSEEERELAETVRRLLSDVAPLGERRALFPAAGEGATGSAPVDESARAGWRQLAELGVAGALVPTDLGGLGLPFAALAGVCEQTGRALYPGPVTSAAVGAASAGTDRALLAGLAAGTLVPVLAAPAGPVQPLAPRDGALTGRLPAVAHAAWADVLLVPVRDGLACVDRADAEVTAEPTTDPTRSYATVALTRAPARVVAGPDEAGVALDRLLAAVLAEAYGAAAAAYELAMAHARTRVQFGRPIGSFQAVQHLLVDAYRGLEVGRLAVRAAFDATDPDRLHRAVTVAKAHASDGFVHVGAAAIQVLGGIGYTWEHDAHLYYRRLLDLQTAFGSATEHLDRLADEVVGA